MTNNYKNKRMLGEMFEYSVKLLMHLIMEIRHQAMRRHIQEHLFPIDIVPQIHCPFNLQHKNKQNKKTTLEGQ